MLSIDDRRGTGTCPTPFNLASYVLENADAPDDKVALAVLSVSGAERWSYGRLRSEVQRLAAQLRAAGLKPGDRLLLRLSHSPTFPIAFLAAAWCGVLPVPTSTLLTRNELSRIAQESEPTAVLINEDMPLPDHAARVIQVGELPDPQKSADLELGSPERPGYILCTSGTSGTPRVVTHPHRAIWARSFMREGWTGLTETDRILHAGAFNWSYTLGTGLFDPWSVGATALVLAPGTDIAALPLLAKRHDATVIAAVPGVFRKLLNHPIPPLPKLRHSLSAGEKLPESLRERWKSTVGTDIHEAFGQTECSTFISGSPDRPAPEGTLGYVQPGRALAITDNGHPVNRGTVGEIAVHRTDPGLALSQEEPLSEWVGTGDMGEMTADGAVLYHGRKDDILTAGGYRVSPLEIEQVFDGAPGIDAAAAVDHRLDDETTVIALYYTGEDPPTPDALAAFGQGKLAPYKLPRVFVHVDTLPVGRNGKLLRRALGAEKDKPS